MDDDEFEGDEVIEEILILDLDEEGRQHNKWTFGTIVLETVSDLFKVGAKFFDNLADAAFQHGTKEIRQRELHELITRDIESLPEYQGEATDG